MAMRYYFIAFPSLCAGHSVVVDAPGRVSHDKLSFPRTPVKINATHEVPPADAILDISDDVKHSPSETSSSSLNEVDDVFETDAGSTDIAEESVSVDLLKSNIARDRSNIVDNDAFSDRDGRGNSQETKSEGVDEHEPTVTPLNHDEIIAQFDRVIDEIDKGMEEVSQEKQKDAFSHASGSSSTAESSDQSARVAGKEHSVDASSQSELHRDDEDDISSAGVAPPEEAPMFARPFVGPAGKVYGPQGQVVQAFNTYEEAVVSFLKAAEQVATEQTNRINRSVSVKQQRINVLLSRAFFLCAWDIQKACSGTVRLE